jgi:hypothetical protein
MPPRRNVISIAAATAAFIALAAVAANLDTLELKNDLPRQDVTVTEPATGSR